MEGNGGAGWEERLESAGRTEPGEAWFLFCCLPALELAEFLMMD